MNYEANMTSKGWEIIGTGRKKELCKLDKSINKQLEDNTPPFGNVVDIPRDNFNFARYWIAEN